MNVTAWLRSLGLEQYAEAFQANAIDGDILPKLTGDDLKDLGVTTVGHRRRLLEAIAALGVEGVSADKSFALSSTQKTPLADYQSTTSGSSQAERRRLTVMFVDLVGSTALSSRLDPEEMGSVIRAYQDAVAGEITRLEGHVAKFMGDGVLAYFGWPRAHENEAERAVHAGLAVLSAIGKLCVPDGEPLAARIGIATGLVVVGDLVGEGSAREEVVIGETPNLAARLQTLAEPGRIVIAESTRRLLGDLFDLEPLGQRSLKGLGEPVESYAILGEQTLESRFAARRFGRLTPIVGREQELALLIERWEQACASEGQMVLLTGEAGIGKSRVTEALIERLVAVDHTRIRYQCSPYHTDSALYPTIQQLGLAARFEAHDDQSARLDKLEALIALSSSDVAGQVPLIAHLLGLDAESRYGTLALSPQQVRVRTLRALVDQLIGLARRKPVHFLIEDAHWIDPTTLELIELSLDAIARERVLVLVTARPTFRHGFGGHPVVTRLVLNRLGRAQVASIVARVTGGKPLPEVVLDEIVAKTDGVPLFVEEVAMAVLESEVLREARDAYELAGPLSALTIPATLHDSLMARLDRQRPVKEVAQIASVIGRAFDYRTLAAIAPQSSGELAGALDRLVEAELVFRRGTPPDANYLFKHALVRDAAYETLLRSKRQAVHARLLATLEAREDVQAEVLAHHAEEAGQVEKAIGYWQRAGDEAVSRPAYREAIAHFQNALRLMCLQAASPDSKEQELRLLVHLGQALIAAQGYGADETVATFARANEIAEELGDALGEPQLRFAAIYGQWVRYFIRSDANLSREQAEHFLTLTERAGDRGARLVALRAVALARWEAGRFHESLALCDEILEGYDPAMHRDLAFQYAHDARVATLNYRSWSLWHLGFPDQAIESTEALMKWAEECDHGNTTGYASSWGAVIIHVLMRRIPEVVTAARRAIPICEELATPLWLSYARAFLGWALSLQGEVDEGLRELNAGIEELHHSGHRRWFSLLHGLKAESLALAGRLEESEAAMDAAFGYLDSTGDQSCAAELYRLAGQLRLSNPRPDMEAAEVAFRRALGIAREQDSKAIELRAATGLARLWRDQGKGPEARGLVAPIYGWFSEGFETPDLIAAKALLDELA